MFRSVTARIALRTVFAAVIAGLTATGTALVGDQSISPAEGVAIALAFFTAAGAWLGVGATTPTEPFLNSSRVVEVPANQIEPT